jgi:hypothetical protein
MESPWKVADEVRLAEERIVRRRRAFARTRDEVGLCAREAVASPGVLASAVVVGFVLGRLMERRPRREPVTSLPSRGIATSGGWMMAALGPLLRIGYGAAVEALWSRALQSRDGRWSERAAAANEDGRAALLSPIKTTRAA